MNSFNHQNKPRRLLLILLPAGEQKMSQRHREARWAAWGHPAVRESMFFTITLRCLPPANPSMPWTLVFLAASATVQPSAFRFQTARLLPRIEFPVGDSWDLYFLSQWVIPILCIWIMPYSSRVLTDHLSTHHESWQCSCKVSRAAHISLFREEEWHSNSRGLSGLRWKPRLLNSWFAFPPNLRWL